MPGTAYKENLHPHHDPSHLEKQMPENSLYCLNEPIPTLGVPKRPWEPPELEGVFSSVTDRNHLQVRCSCKVCYCVISLYLPQKKLPLKQDAFQSALKKCLCSGHKSDGNLAHS